MKNVFHVRLIAPLEQRVQRIMTHNQLDAKTARELIHKKDLGRKRYLKDHFHADIDDNLLYDLVINTSRHPRPHGGPPDRRCRPAMGGDPLARSALRPPEDQITD